MTHGAVAAGWAVLAAGLVACAVVPLLPGSRMATLFTLTRRLTRRRPAVVAAFAGWLWVGWHLFAR